MIFLDIFAEKVQNLRGTVTGSGLITKGRRFPAGCQASILLLEGNLRNSRYLSAYQQTRRRQWVSDEVRCFG